MMRWNISTIFFIGVSGKRRDVELQPGEVNIITGASGTGKSTLIKAIDYCLGSSKCELPAHVRRRSVAVGIKWVSDNGELVVGRIVPPVGQDTSTRMFTASGYNLHLPNTVNEFEGSATVNAAKTFLEQAFGIVDAPGDVDATTSGVPRGRATVRQITPYLFVTKEVIHSETVLLHGLEKADIARHIVETMSYFLRVTDERTALDERRLRQLRYALEKEEVRERARAAADTLLKQRAISLLTEAHRLGLAPEPPADGPEEELLARVEEISRTELEPNTYPREDELGALQDRRRRVLGELSTVRSRSHATKTAIREASGFEGVVHRQHEKLMLAEHLKLEDVAEICPLCDSPSERGRKTAQTLQAVLSKIRDESAAVGRMKPQLLDHDRVLEQEIDTLNRELRVVDDQTRSWLRQSDETKRLTTLAQARAHLLGRISYFLESSSDETRQTAPDLNVLRDEIGELEARIDREAKEIRLQRAEAKISQFATENFSRLPTAAPCIGSELRFSARKPEVAVFEAGSDALLRMTDLGSDQNYLAIHIALSFGLQRYFEVTQSPVPGVLVLDQISRPYFPTSGEDVEEREVKGREEDEDEDVQAMRKHIDFLFKETARRPGLQVLLIEHAYFADDHRYVAATKERWTRASGRGLIPSDWSVRPDQRRANEGSPE
jgi:energy-coupling factor transporter ATP-binding protein EcfA2